MAAAARNEGRTVDAERHLERVVQADTRAVEPRLELAELLLAEGAGVTRAVALLDDAALLQPPSARAERLRGWADELSGDDAAAVAAYGRSLALAPDPEVRLRRGQILDRLGRMQEAVTELTQVTMERPADRTAHAALADILERQGRIRDAEGELLQLAALAPNDPGPRRRLAAFYLRHGEKTRALAAEAAARDLEGAPRALRPLRPSKR